MARQILTPLQQRFIHLIAGEKTFQKNFYLTGGTALSAYYLKHRYSEDLDFFTCRPVDILAINVFLKKIKSLAGISKIDFEQSFNRNIFFLHVKKDVLKAEFTYFPFEQIEPPIHRDGIAIDSIVDIAVNKAFTILQNPRSRDFIDLYFILKKYRKFTLEGLLKFARAKFDAQIDPLQLGTQFLKAKDILDLPRMLKKLDHNQWRGYFLKEAESLSKKIFK